MEDDVSNQQSDQFSRSFTGRSRSRKTKARVKIMDRVARTLITIGGMGTVLAVSTVFIYLVYIAVPLFFSSSVEESIAYETPWAEELGAPIQTIIDEYQVMGYAMFEDGSVQVFAVETGERLGELRRPLGDRTPTAWSFSSDADDVSFGFSDGTAVLAWFGFETEFIPDELVEGELLDLRPGASMVTGDTVVTHTTAGQYRRRVFYSRVNPPVDLAGSGIRLIAHTIRSSGPVIVAMTDNDNLAINSVSIVRNFLTGAETANVSRNDLPYQPIAEKGDPAFLLLSGLGDVVYLAWQDGHLKRYDLRDVQNPQLAESVELLDSAQAVVTTVRFMIGRTTLIVGDSQGNVRTFFRIRREVDNGTSDGQYLVATHDLGRGPAAVTSVTASARSRMMTAGFADGTVNLYHVTTNQLLASARFQTAGTPVNAVAMAPKDDAILAVAGDRIQAWTVDRKHPTINLASISRPVWYEGASEPDHVWQSSAGTDDFEPKYGLWPLVFGTLKATFYSMLFGLPIALAAAVYTSEFMHPRVKSRIKPLVEMMASLPSVVLGFLAALVIAPFIEDIVPGTLMCFFTVPFFVLLGAYVWQLLPGPWTIQLQSLGTQKRDDDSPITMILSSLARAIASIGGIRFVAVTVCVVIGLLVGLWIGPAAEWLLFAGDIKRWLDGQIGTAWGGWVILLLPVSAVIVAVLMSMFVNPMLRQISTDWSRTRLAGVDLAKFAVGCVVALGMAAGIAGLLTAGGLALDMDIRGGGIYNPMSTYVQRNALVVGFIMGFAIIPIIYTIAEDALSAVPDHLRAASLGAGATPWQTGVRIIIPTAMSGLFSATMIGLGRAVGETMIVLMAAGNTPLRQMNIFNGFRTLSANIAVELPEAPLGGTHYRVLFLAALTLFLMTFVVNTIAEVIRIRFRKRAFQL